MKTLQHAGFTAPESYAAIKAIGKKHSFRIYLQSKEKADEIVDGVEREQKKQKSRGKEKPLRTKNTERIA